MPEINKLRFEELLSCVHSHENGIYKLYDNNGNVVEATYGTDYASDNDLELDEDGYEEFQSIIFEHTSNNFLFEVNYYKIPVKIICDGKLLYE
ncbi:MAG: hypothetical protein HUJ51_04140 [Eggerthellaceae bacterium]|nr:hypothetical protein [Eggerthellaceae bacterium]